MNRNFARFLMVSSVFVLSAGCGAVQAEPGLPEAGEARKVAAVGSEGEPQAARNEAPEEEVLSYRIGPGDSVEVFVWKNAEVSRTVPVKPDGSISLPLVGEVRAGDLTPGELSARLEEEFSEYIPAAEVSVIVREVGSFYVYLVGEAGQGRFALQNDQTTVLELIAMAGGLNEFASESRIKVLRRRSDGTMQRIPFDYDDALEGDPKQNFYLEPGDVVVVP